MFIGQNGNTWQYAYIYIYILTGADDPWKHLYRWHDTSFARSPNPLRPRGQGKLRMCPENGCRSSHLPWTATDWSASAAMGLSQLHSLGADLTQPRAVFTVGEMENV